MSRSICLFALIIICQHLYSQQRTGRPKIGLTLSGGTAKGLAHIGILKAIDSAGLKIDYITGTSMGSIIGGLYAIGYAADSIEKMAQKTDWDQLLTNQSSLRSIIMEEKEEYGKYMVELPWVNHSFKLPSGLLEGQELWLSLAELFSPASEIKDFSKFSIPFKCIGTNVENGEAIVMDHGELVTAIRSSIAIPSVFTAVDYEGKKVVDGGIVRNLPVKDVKDMGADYVIGSNVATGLFPGKKVLNALQILLQIAFFREADDRKNEVPLCNIYIAVPLEKYATGNFNQSKEIMQVGLEEGRRMYPVFKKLVDSLDAIYGKQDFITNRLPPPNKSVITDVEVLGLEHTSKDFFVHTMNFLTNKYYNAEELSGMIRKAFGTRYYSRITYSLVAQNDGTKKIIFDVTENPLTFAKIGIHYNELTSISIVANLTSRNFLLPNSRDLVTLNIGENVRLRAEHLQYFGRMKKFALIASTQTERLKLNTFHDFNEDGIYRQSYLNVDGRFQFSTARQFTIGIGMRHEWIKYYPSITSDLDIKGNNDFSTVYSYLSHNSLDRATYPKRGLKIDVESDLVLQQDPDIVLLRHGQPIDNPDSIGLRYNQYRRVLFNLRSYAPLSERLVFMLQAQTGINFNYKQHIMNEFQVGGLTNLFRNQVTFAGLKESTLYSPSLACLQLGLRYQLFNNTYLIGRGNALLNNFITKSIIKNSPDFLSGYSVTLAYNFALGPLELSAMYCDQSKQLRTYVNLGIPF